MSESESTRKDFPDWENLYKSQSVETMPWYNERFDSDLERELDQRKVIANGKKFLDLGTGPATQAIWLLKRGFSVIGSDLSEAAINRARKVYASEKNVNFIADDIVNTKKSGKVMNLIIFLIEAVSMSYPQEIEKNTSTKSHEY
jgi:ubiquinone/menaquinone biosynthesis C-methylase UbiE